MPGPPSLQKVYGLVANITTCELFYGFHTDPLLRKIVTSILSYVHEPMIKEGHVLCIEWHPYQLPRPGSVSSALT